MGEHGSTAGDNLSYLKAMAEAGRRTRLVPALLCADLSRTRAFYNKLGFTSEYPDGASQRPRRLGLERDGIYLFFYDEPIGAHKTPVMSGTLYVFPESVDALATEWQDKVKFIWGPELMPYGLYEFAIADPDGYHLAFAERRVSSPSPQ